MQWSSKSRNKLWYLQLIDFHKDAKAIQWGKYSLLNKQCWYMGYPYGPQNEFKPLPTPYKKKRYLKTYHKPKSKSQNYKNFRKQKKTIWQLE